MNEVRDRKIGRSFPGRQKCLLLAALLSSLVLAPRHALSMAADGTLITNYCTATYGGPGGTQSYSPLYTVSYLATQNVLVSCPVVSLMKVATPTIQSAAGIVTFQIWIANTSVQASAFNVVVSDMLPDNMTYANTLTFWWNGTAPGVTNAVSANNTAWQTGVPVVGQGSPYYLRWTLDKLAPVMLATFFRH